MAATSTSPRRFTLLDAMALIAAAAVGLAMSREWSRASAESILARQVEDGPLHALAPVTREVVLGWPVVAMVTLALVALRLRRPRPRARRLFAPPGAAACLIASIARALQAAGASCYWVYLMVKTGFQYVGVHWNYMVYPLLLATASPAVGFAVLAAWAWLILTRRWRRERGWLDRAGIVVGWLWIALSLLRLHLRMNSHLDVT